MINDNLRFLLKEKYSFTESEIDEAGTDYSILISNLSKILRRRNETSLIDKLNNDLKLLKSDYPIDYIIGHKPFLNCFMDLSFKTLIPRTETEYWVNLAIKEIPDKKEINILDIFCGSGCIGIAVLKSRPQAKGTFADLDSKALEQTKFNLDLNKISPHRYEIVKSDVFSSLKATQFDYIFANPPYVADHEEVQSGTKHEPHSAIFSGTTGLEIIKEFIKQLKTYLSADGVCYMEFGWEQKEKIEALLMNYQHEFFKDQYNRWRFVKITQKI